MADTDVPLVVDNGTGLVKCGWVSYPLHLVRVKTALNALTHTKGRFKCVNSLGLPVPQANQDLFDAQISLIIASLLSLADLSYALKSVDLLYHLACL